jgi:hypothetical protein
MNTQQADAITPLREPDAMLFEPYEQRSDDWLKARLGKPTASQFHRLITPGGKRSTQADAYAAELIAERIFQAPMGKNIGGIPAVKYGRETEVYAAKKLEELLGEMIAPGGIAWPDERKRYGASPDGLVATGNMRELVEIKCPFEIPVHVRSLLYGVDRDHWAQIQGQLLVTGYDAVHFYSYRSDCPPYHNRVERDAGFISALAGILNQFCDQLDVDERRARAMGGWAI